MAEPFLKWAGGKAKLADQIAEHLGQAPIARYYEPFLGGGAVFFRLEELGRVKRATLGDSLEPLVGAYQAVREKPGAVARLTNEIPGDEESYYGIRQQGRLGTRGAQTPQAAATFIYLNKRGFNGLCRYNKKGEFNVPFGGERKPGFLPAPLDRLVACSGALLRAKIVCGDFESIVRDARAGDAVYCDPPYIPTSPTSNFTSYEPDGFGKREHERLATVARRLLKKGVRVVLSNADMPLAHELYAGKEFQIHRVAARRSINSKGARRGPVGELIIVGQVKGKETP
jgi:DNA adenine methylase